MLSTFEKNIVTNFLSQTSAADLERLIDAAAPLLRTDQLDALRRAIDRESQRRA